MQTNKGLSQIATHFKFTKARLLALRDRFLTESSNSQLDCYDTDAKGTIIAAAAERLPPRVPDLRPEAGRQFQLR